MAGRHIHYLTVQNGTYSMLFDHLLPELNNVCSPTAKSYLSRVSDNKRGDIFETCAAKMFFAGNRTGILELGATIFMIDAMWTHGFEEAKKRWQLACLCRGEEASIKAAKFASVPPPTQHMDTSGSRPTEAGVASSSSEAAAAERRHKKDKGTAFYIPSHYITQERAAEEQRISGSVHPWANIPGGWKPPSPEDDSEPILVQDSETEEQQDVVANPWIPSKQAEGPEDWWN